MKRTFKIISLSVLSIIGICLVLFLLVRFMFREQITDYLYEIQHKTRLEVLRSSGAYINSPKVDIHFKYKKDSVQATKLKEYFRLDTLISPEFTTWENAVALASFVARHIPHANQTIQPEARNAIALWKYHLEVEPAFNCRLHAIMLHELLLASDITNRFIICMPNDSTDQDCHVVNIVWLPEQQKWAMIDSDRSAYITNSDGTPLSLEEMRQYSIEGKEMKVHPLLEDGEIQGKSLSYWAKNLYWFACWEETGYDKETKNEGRYIYLLPQGFEGFGLRDSSLCTSDAARFWVVPEN